MNTQISHINVPSLGVLDQNMSKRNMAILVSAAIIALCALAFPLSHADAQGIRREAIDTRRAIIDGARGDAQVIRDERKAAVEAIRKDRPASSTPPGEVWKGVMEVRAGAKADLRENRLDAKGELEANRIRHIEAMKGLKEERKGEQKGELKRENVEQRKAAIEARHAELKARLEAKKAERKNASSTPEKLKKLDENAKKRVDQKIGVIYDRLNDRIAGLTKVDTEISARLSAIPAEIDKTVAASLLVTAQAALAQAKIDVEATKTLASSETMGTTTKAALRTLVETAEASIKAAGKAYRAVMDAIKALPKPERKVEVEAGAGVEANVKVEAGTN